MIDEAKIRDMVRRIVLRAVEGAPAGSPPAPAASPATRRADRPLVTQDQVESIPAGGRLQAPPGALVTPLARQAALERRVSIGRAESATVEAASPAGERPGTGEGTTRGVVAVAADHGGFEMKQMLGEHLRQAGYRVIDCGTDGPDAVDYPDFALAAAQLVASGRAWRGIVVDGAGIGSCMAANKVPGVRAAMCYDEATAVNSREHNHANVLTLGAGLIGPALARRIVDTWLHTPEGADRHARRVRKIMDIERRYAKDST